MPKINHRLKPVVLFLKNPRFLRFLFPCFCRIQSVVFIKTSKGINMKTFLYILIVLTVTSSPAMARVKLRAGDNNRCFINVSGINHFWYCGSQSSDCADKKLRKYHDRTYQYHGDEFTSEDRHFWCCNGTKDTAGKYVETTAPFSTSEVVTVDLGNGTCTYEKITNVCGDVIDNPCTEPTNCTDGTILRNDSCVTPCNGNTAFESTASNKCIECETTAYQGISADNICTKCDSGTQFFDTKTQNCVSKDTFNRITKEAMEKCYGCPNNETFKDCATLFSMSESNRRAADNYQQIIKDCYITEGSDSDTDN